MLSCSSSSAHVGQMQTTATEAVAAAVRHPSRSERAAQVAREQRVGRFRHTWIDCTPDRSTSSAAAPSSTDCVPFSALAWSGGAPASTSLAPVAS